MCAALHDQSWASCAHASQCLESWSVLGCHTPVATSYHRMVIYTALDSLDATARPAACALHRTLHPCARCTTAAPLAPLDCPPVARGIERCRACDGPGTVGSIGWRWSILPRHDRGLPLWQCRAWQCRANNQQCSLVASLGRSWASKPGPAAVWVMRAQWHYVFGLATTRLGTNSAGTAVCALFGAIDITAAAVITPFREPRRPAGPTTGRRGTARSRRVVSH